MQSLWQHNARFKKFPSLDGDIKTDVAIVGGGIAGILTAYFLKQAGVQYVLIEKNRLCSSTTGHTTGKITVGHGLIYDKLIRAEGLASARAYYRLNSEALDVYSELCRRIDCDFEYKDNFVYLKNDKRALEAELGVLEQIGARARLRESLPIPIDHVGAVCIPHQAQFNPLKFLAEISRELNIFENTHAIEVSDGRVLTDKGTVTADQVIVTTHFPITDSHGLYFLKMYQHRSYVLALEGAAQVDGMYVDGDSRGMSFRNYGKYLLLGGGGHRTGKRGGGYEQLRAFAEANYPHAEEKYAWAAQDCMTLDSVPYIGRYSRRTRGMYVATGFNKWGMTGAMLSAMLLSGSVIGQSIGGADVFNPSRSIFKPQLLFNTLETVKNLLTPTAPRCSHLGCALKWNRAEHTWDCACHGSRFTEQGELLDTPSNKNLR